MDPSGFPAGRGNRSEPRILVATEDDALGARLAGLLDKHLIEVTAERQQGLLDLLSRQPALRLLIIGDVDSDGPALELLAAVKEQRQDLAVLVLSSHPTIKLATDAIRRGAEDFVPLPYSEELLLKEVHRILDAAELRDRVESLHRLVADTYGFDRIVSHSSCMRAVFERARAASRSDTPTLIVGETGTGKELVARAIHANSRRARKPFVPLNCAALPRDLVESELFGHRRGAFSGAQTDHAGLFVSAHGGSLFLDEISDLPAESQAKLLRVLQDGEVRPIGGLESRKVDVRIIAATNRSLAALGGGDMRQDLFFRLSVLVIELPPLRERVDDLPLLIAFFLARIRDRGIARVDSIDAPALELLMGYSFPGNVRELENMLEGISVTLPPDRTAIRPEDVRGWLRHRGQPSVAGSARPGVLRLDELALRAITEALRQTQGNKRRAAQLLGISRDTLYRKLQESVREANLSDNRT
jgi:two-component system, NtrC family, response regulator AtoC